jgi:hypothetical protein
LYPPTPYCEEVNSIETLIHPILPQKLHLEIGPLKVGNPMLSVVDLHGSPNPPSRCFASRMWKFTFSYTTIPCCEEVNLTKILFQLPAFKKQLCWKCTCPAPIKLQTAVHLQYNPSTNVLQTPTRNLDL